jgi:endo-1,4-beta-xylanase
MYFVKTLFTLVAAASAVLGAPSQEFAPAAVEKRQNPTYSKNWSNDQANVTYENRAGGVYAVNWLQPNGGNFVVGKGFNPAREVALKYSGTFTLGQESNTYLALYGWVYGPTAEFYVIENFGVHHPADNKNSTCYGYIDSDGGRYEIWMKWQLSNGNPTFRQYWAVVSVPGPHSFSFFSLTCHAEDQAPHRWNHHHRQLLQGLGGCWSAAQHQGRDGHGRRGPVGRRLCHHHGWHRANGHGAGDGDSYDPHQRCDPDWHLYRQH